MLFELATLVISYLGADTTLAAICSRVRRTFAAESTAILVRDGAGFSVAAADAVSMPFVLGVEERRAAQAVMNADATPQLAPAARAVGRGWRRRNVRLPDVFFAPMAVSGESVGLLRIAGSPMLGGGHATATPLV